MVASNDSSGLTTKDILLQLVATVDGLDKKVDAARDSQIRTETIIAEGKYGERLSALEAWKNRTDGAAMFAKFAVGGSLLSLVLGAVSLYLTLTGQKG